MIRKGKMMERYIFFHDKRCAQRLLSFCLFTLMSLTAVAQGVPFLKNYSTQEYNAHNYNFDIDISEDGTVYVANFEGLLYYDHANWRLLHSPGINRITVVFCDKSNRVWIGGYNYFGRVQIKPNGDLGIKRIGKLGQFIGEVEEIWEKNGTIYFFVNDGKSYKVEDDKIHVEKIISRNPINIGLSDILDVENLIEGKSINVLSDITQTEPIDNFQNAVVKKGNGILITNKENKILQTITETNGLCTDNVSYIGYDGHGQVWGATDNGIFSIAVPSVYSRFSEQEGLKGEVLSIEEYKGTKYVGTNNGLFRIEGQSLINIEKTIYGCWKLTPSPNGLYAATSSGIFLIGENGGIRRLTENLTMALLIDGDQYYSGEIDGVYLTQLNGQGRHKVCSLKKVLRIYKDADGSIWLQSLYGEVWVKLQSESHFKLYKTKHVDESSVLVPVGDKLMVVGADSTEPFPYPLFSYYDEKGVTWLTDNVGKNIYRWKDGKRLNDMDELLNPLKDISVRAMFVKGSEIWIGSEKGLWIINCSQPEPSLLAKPRLMFRTVKLGTDSILWGGFGKMPESLPELDSNERHLIFTYALNHTPMVGNTLYRYKLNNGKWSAWSQEKEAEFLNMPHGSYTIYIQALLPTGENSEVVSLDFSIAYPFYVRWYMLVFYLLLLVAFGFLLFRYRLHRLSEEKSRLESVVQERTAEVVKQKDEIEEKSRSLETALSKLHQTQSELIRQEKMATVGKLTQGLIDRILNPLNYINNFSKLSEGLVKDIKANIEDEEKHMDKENYDDTIDVLNMLSGNLKKVGEHGINTTRTLKAMEEMLKDRSGGIVPMDLAALLRQNDKMLHTYYAAEISKYGIKTVFECPETSLNINGNAEQLSKAFMSLLANAVYAVEKKAQRDKFTPEISFIVTTSDNHVCVLVRDNGIGIEETIIDKIFDPFFTTKTTGEASGVGLYLSREIIQNHGGDISVKSEKNEFTEFTVSLPTP